jgi:hypothetical protein
VPVRSLSVSLWQACAHFDQGGAHGGEPGMGSPPQLRLARYFVPVALLAVACCALASFTAVSRRRA